MVQRPGRQHFIRIKPNGLEYMASTKNNDWDFSGLKALYFNATLTKSPDESHTDRLIKISKDIMDKHRVQTEVVRVIDHPAIATGVWPDMREHGWDKGEWP